MLHGSPRDFAPRLPAAALWLLCALYLLTGIVGHDPWKTEDAIHIGIAHGFASAGDLLFPYIAGEPWPHTAPLYHWSAALLGSALDGWLPFHDAARLATPLFGALFLFALAGAARTFHGTNAGRLAPLLAIGTLGLLTPLHEAQPAVAGLACAALAWWGGGLVLQNRTSGAVPLGLGLGLAFPAHGLAGVLMAIAVLPAPLMRRDWKALAIALGIALPLLAAWPLLLANHAPELWSVWWHNEIAEATQARSLPREEHFEQITWILWPLLPLAFWSLWLHRRQAAPLALPLLGALLGLAWFLTGSYRQLALLPAMIPLALLSAAGADRLRRGAGNAFDWFGIVTFSFFAALAWLGASAQALDWPPRIAANFEKLAPGHQTAYSFAALAFSAAMTLAWLWLWRLPRAPWRAVLRWAAGTTLIWVLAAQLWMSWLDHAKSYRPVALSLRAALPQDYGCIARKNIGPAQRASLDYFVGLRTLAGSRAETCRWRLVADATGHAAPPGWVAHWQGHRPSDRKERWYLERREN
ncbi:MAG: hypothetical protein AB1642_06690 [Pseudomonadota bacterium]